MSRLLRVAVFLASGLVLLSVLLLFVVDYRSNYPYVSFSSFSTVKQFLAFKKNIVKSYLYDWANGIRPSRSGSRVGFDLIDPKDPKAVEFRKRAGLDAVLGGAQTEFDKLMRLREWAHLKVWPVALSPNPRRMKGKDAFILLAGIEENAVMICSEAAELFAQALGTVGLIGREVSANGTATAEAWSPEHNKWVLMDPLYNAHYEKAGVPLSFVELMRIFYSDGQPDPNVHARRWNREVSKISISREDAIQKILEATRRVYAEEDVLVKGGPRTLPRDLPAEGWKPMLLGLFSDINPGAFSDYAVALRSDYLIYNYPKWHLRYYDHMWNYLHWSGSLLTRPANAFQVSNDLKDFYWKPRGADARR